MNTQTEAPAKPAPPKPGTNLVAAHRCGFCQTGFHQNCPGATANGNGVMVVCPCKCKGLVCRLCRSEEQVDSTTWTCVDKESCRHATLARRQALREANGYHLPEMPVQSRRFAEGATEARKQAEIDAADRHGPFLSAPKPRKAKDGYDPAPFGSRCHCGCKGSTKGGRFLPGHDAKLKALLSDQVRTHKDRARRVVARAEQLARGVAWSKGCDKVAEPYAEEAGKLLERQGADGVVAFQVRARESVAK